MLNSLVDLGRRLLGNRRKEWKRRDSELSKKLVKSTNVQENILGIWIQQQNLEEDIRYYFLILVIQFLLIGLLVLFLLIVV